MEKLKFELTMSKEQAETLKELQVALKADSLAEVIRKSLCLAELYKNTSAKGQKLALVDEKNNILNTLVFK